MDQTPKLTSYLNRMPEGIDYVINLLQALCSQSLKFSRAKYVADQSHSSGTMAGADCEAAASRVRVLFLLARTWRYMPFVG